jgi:hypothetical protein
MTIMRLEDNKDHPIGIVDKIMVTKDRIYVLDRSKARSLFIYDKKDARFLNVIHRIGQGPGEFALPQDFDVDRETGNIVIMDITRKLIFYTPACEFIKEVRFDFVAVACLLENKDQILMDNSTIPTKGDSCCLRRIDLNGKDLNSFFTSERSTSAVAFSPPASLQRCNNELFYFPAASNCIYRLDGDSYTPAYIIDFGSAWPSKDFWSGTKDTHPMEVKKKLLANSHICFLNAVQTKDALHLGFQKGEKKYSLYYNKTTGKTLLIPMDDDTFTCPLGAYENEFVFAKYKDDAAPTLVFSTVHWEWQ